MKKLVAVLTIICLLIPVIAMAESGCGEPLIPTTETSMMTFTGCSWWAISEDNFVIGKLEESEKVPILPTQNPKKNVIRGFLDNGLVRRKGSMNFLMLDGQMLGLTKLKVTVSIFDEYRETIESIVYRRFGEEADISANAIIACTTWIQGESIYHIFWPSIKSHVAIGTVTVNDGLDTITLYAGDHNGDGLLELGFAAGWQQTPSKPEPEPESSTPTRICVRRCETRTSCNKINVSINNIQIGLINIMNNCIRFVKGCTESLKK